MCLRAGKRNGSVCWDAENAQCLGQLAGDPWEFPSTSVLGCSESNLLLWSEM